MPSAGSGDTVDGAGGDSSMSMAPAGRLVLVGADTRAAGAVE